jgi:hypothetical protein
MQSQQPKVKKYALINAEKTQARLFDGIHAGLGGGRRISE